MVIKVEFRDNSGDLITGLTPTFVEYTVRSTNTLVNSGLPTLTAAVNDDGRWYFNWDDSDEVIDYKITATETVAPTTTYTVEGTADPTSARALELLQDYTVAVPITALNPHTYTVLDGSENPIPGVIVWVTSNEAGTALEDGPKTTDFKGEVIFNLLAGTHWVHRSKDGYIFNPNPIQWDIT